ncbi:alpha/beta hydrolase fold domain-containing protein [Rhodococcus sp. USK13]|uniref:alpha/beta hydrolase n=1 Tax=Rhodococcus sp. USK13 TaxID=2806442 RepID=UPI001BCD879F|nr:alpha/beta hydrolase fold domain-containing protein [Rhodococcus sp. USK13]
MPNDHTLSASAQQALLDYMRSFRVPSGWDLRGLLTAFEAAMDFEFISGVSLSHVTVIDRSPWGLRAEVLAPTTPGPWPVLVYLHGGGWTTGHPQGYRRVSHEMARRGAVVVCPDYRRAPRHRFPAAIDDARRSIEWATQNSTRFGGDPTRVSLVGDSAGANLAAGTLSAGLSTEISHIVLAYGIFDVHAALETLGPIVGGPGAHEQLYLPTEQFENLRLDPRVNPIQATESWPQLLVLSGTEDPLHSQSRGLVARRRDLGDTVVESIYPGTPHGFLQLPFLKEHVAAHDAIHQFIND